MGAIGVLGDGVALLAEARLATPVPGADGLGNAAGVVVQATAGPPSDAFVAAFVEAVAAHRHFDRPLDAVAA